MSSKGLFTQLGIAIISIAIILTYIKPTFAEITKMQDDIAVYQSESGTVTSVNAQLSADLEQLGEVTVEDRRKLFAYMPDKVDTIAIQRDLSLITKESGAFYITSSYTGTLEDLTSGDLPKKSSFQLSVDGTYGQIKNLLRLLEINQYLFEVTQLSVNREGSGFLTADFTLVVYSYQPFENDNQLVF